jgi:RNA polymerase sigma-70 factor (ECF subfamily)
VTGDAAEIDLIRRAAAGDAPAFEALVRAHAAAVVSIATAELGDPTTGAEVAQDVFVRLHRSLSTFRHEARLRTWLVRVTINACADQRRARRRRDRRLVPMEGIGPRDAGALVDRAESFESLESRRVDRVRVRAAIDELPAALRVLIVLRYDAGLEYREIAHTLSMPQGTVATRMARALRQLRAALSAPDSKGTP